MVAINNTQQMSNAIEGIKILDEEISDKNKTYVKYLKRMTIPYGVKQVITISVYHITYTFGIIHFVVNLHTHFI